MNIKESIKQRTNFVKRVLAIVVPGYGKIVRGVCLGFSNEVSRRRWWVLIVLATGLLGYGFYGLWENEFTVSLGRRGRGPEYFFRDEGAVLFFLGWVWIPISIVASLFSLRDKKRPLAFYHWFIGGGCLLAGVFLLLALLLYANQCSALVLSIINC